MAACLADTEEKINGSKLSRLLVDGGTDAMRRIFDSIHSAATLQRVLHTHQPQLNRLRHKRVINSEQWKLLYPQNGALPDSNTFDITLLFVLLRNICGLSAPVTGWNSLPLETDKSTEAELTRIKCYRNHIYGHISSTGIRKTEFEKYWKEISKVLITLGVDSVSIILLKSLPLGETDYVKLLEQWTDSEQTLKKMLHELGEGLKQSTRAGEKTQSELEQTEKEIRKNNRRLEKLISEVSKHEESCQAVQKDSFIVKKLAKSDFRGSITSLVNQHQTGTGMSVLSRVQQLLDSGKSQVLLLTGRPGVGKSVLAAVTCQMTKEQRKLAACQFIEYNNSLRNNPTLIIENIASQLCDAIPGFQQKLQERLSRNLGKGSINMNCTELFAVFLEEPLSAIECSTDNTLIVIDALDECDSNLKDEFINALFHVIPKLPKYLKFMITTRPIEGKILDQALAHVIDLDAENAKSGEDIALYLNNHFQQTYPDDSTTEIQLAVSHLASKSDGLFLFAHFAIDFIKTAKPALSEVANIFPRGITSVYEEYFTRLLNEMPVDEDKFFSFLEAVVAAQGPIPEDIVLSILGLRTDLRQYRKISTNTLRRLYQLFPSRSKHLTAFHRSVVEWLTGSVAGDKEHAFTVEVKDGHRVLADQCLEHLRNVKSHTRYPPLVSDCESYALKFGFQHLMVAGGCEHELNIIAKDLELLSAKSLLSPLKGLENIYETIEEESKENQEFIKNLDFFLNSTNDSYPQAVLQAALNCSAASTFHKEAARLLSTAKYRSLPCVAFTRPQWEFHAPTLPRSVSDFQVSLGGNFAACVGGTNTRKPFVTLFNLSTRNTLVTVIRRKWSARCAISHNGDFLALAAEHVELVNTGSLEVSRVLKANTKPFSCSFLETADQSVGSWVHRWHSPCVECV